MMTQLETIVFGWTSLYKGDNDKKKLINDVVYSSDQTKYRISKTKTDLFLTRRPSIII